MTAKKAQHRQTYQKFPHFTPPIGLDFLEVPEEFFVKGLYHLPFCYFLDLVEKSRQKSSFLKLNCLNFSFLI